jgi:DNA-binding NarL/FixJ family response regulator
MRVAILDDHRIVLESLTRLLAEAGVEVTAVCDSAEEFLAQVRRDPPDAALIDLTLGAASSPEGGLQVLRQLREQARGTATLVLSATTDPALVADCYREGASGYLFKRNASLTDIVRALQAVGRGEKVFPAEAFESLKRAPAVAHAPPALKLARLTARERDVLSLLASGHDNLKIAALLGIGERTVKTHVAGLYRKLGVENRVQLALLARQLGLAGG